jgi:RNA polymerase sigma-70 factor (ECF subfamily)
MTSPLPPSISSIYRAEFPFVHRLVKRLGVPSQQADDAAQEVFVVVHRRFNEFRPDTSMRAWLYAVSVRVCQNLRRSVRRRGRLFQQPTAFEMATDQLAYGPGDEAERQESRRRLLAAVSRLSPRKREVLLLFDVEQLTAREVAAVLVVSPNAVASRLRAARRDLRLELGREDEAAFA